MPTISVNETLTDNVASAEVQKKSDQITDISPGIRIEGSGGRSKLRFDYQMHNLFYAQDSSRNQTQNSLNASGTLEALENWLFIDASGNIFQQSVSAFGVAPTSSSVNTNVNNNVTETSIYRISPHIKGSFGSFADYQLRYSLSSNSSQTGSVSDSTTKTWAGSLKGNTRLANLGWTTDLNAMTIDQASSRSKEDNRLRFVLTYQVTPQFQVSLIAGREENNFQTLKMESDSTSGYGFSWSPTDRTKMDFTSEDRFFGPSNTFKFSHRTARTAWTMSASKDVTSQQSQGNLGLGATYDLLTIIFAADPRCSALPPAEKEVCARGLAATAPAALLQGGFQANQVVVQQLRQISFALLGVRNTVTFAATQNRTENLSIFNGLGVPLGSGPSQNNVDQLGLSVNWSHQLTSLSSLVGTFARSNSKGTGMNTLETTQDLMSVNFTTRLGPKTNAGIGARRTVVDSTTNYTENALTGVLSHQF